MRFAPMFDLLRGQHMTLLGFGVRWRPLLDYCDSIVGGQMHAYVIAAQHGPAFSAIIDVQGLARAACADDALFVIRSGKYVGFVTRCTDFTPLIDYLRRIALPCADEKTVICNG